MTPIAEAEGLVTVECANRHRHAVPMPADPAARQRVRSWIARRAAQLYVQQERWDSEKED